jgi:AAA domain
MSEITVCPGCGVRSGEDYDGQGRCWSCHEANLKSDESPAAAITFVSPAELRASVPPEPDWIWPGYVAHGALTVVAGKPKAGKSTLALALADAVASGATAFLDRGLAGAPVVYISEEGAGTLAHKAGAGDIRFATRESAWPQPDWPSLITAAIAEANRVKGAMIVIDTFAMWAGLGPEAEKDAGAVQRAMEPLVAATRTGLAVLLVVHARKGGGEDGEAIRGSSALAGAADIVLELDRIQGASPRQRKLLALSRYPQTPGVIVIEQEAANGVWSVIGEGADRGDAREITDRSALLDALATAETLTRAELEELMGSPQRQWHTTLERLIETDVVGKSGAGKKGDPYVYKKLRADAAHRTAQHLRRNGEAAAFEDAAHPVGGQHQKHAAAPSPDSVRCAVSEPSSEADDRTSLDADAELDRITGKFNQDSVEAEW